MISLPPEARLSTCGESICPYCGVGCRLTVEAEDDRLKRVRGVEDAPANLGGICAKGATLADVIQTHDRVRRPLIRSDRSEEFVETTWEQSLAWTAARFRAIIAAHGPDSVAFYGSGQLDTEAVYLVGKLFKGSIGTNNTDSNSRLCMASAVAGYRSSLGSDGPPTCYEDIDDSDCIVVWGSNMAEAHPVTFDRVKARRKDDPRVDLIVVDPRFTPTAKSASLHVAVAPGGDIALANAVARLLIERGAVDADFVADHVAGFTEYRDQLLATDWRSLVEASGVSPSVISRFADRIARSKRMLTFYSMGMNQSTVGVWKNNSLINIHLITGQIGRRGAGPFSLTGQPNAMGGREAGLLAQQLPGYRQVDDAEHRAELERYWNLPSGSISERPGLTAIEMFRALETGRLKAIWIAATNPMVSLPDLHQAKRALAKAELVVVSDAYHPTETSRMADVIFPAAQWSEKEGTSTNSERMVSYSEAIVAPPGEALPDWKILADFGCALGYQGFDFQSIDQVWDEFIPLTSGRVCDMAGMTAERLRRERHLQWPCPSVDHPGSKRLYLDRVFPTVDGKARLLARPHREPREKPDDDYPFVLTTGRVYAHWHTLTRTGKSAKLNRRDPGPYVEVNPDDAGDFGLEDGELAEVTSPRGTLRLPVRLNQGMRRGLAFIPFHWGAELVAANYLTIAAVDRVSKQPEFKYCSIRIEPVHARRGPRNGESASGSRSNLVETAR